MKRVRNESGVCIGQIGDVRSRRGNKERLMEKVGKGKEPGSGVCPPSQSSFEARLFDSLSKGLTDGHGSATSIQILPPLYLRPCMRVHIVTPHPEELKKKVNSLKFLANLPCLAFKVLSLYYISHRLQILNNKNIIQNATIQSCFSSWFDSICNTSMI